MTEDVDFIALGGINKNNYKSLGLLKLLDLQEYLDKKKRPKRT